MSEIEIALEVKDGSLLLCGKKMADVPANAEDFWQSRIEKIMGKNWAGEHLLCLESREVVRRNGQVVAKNLATWVNEGEFMETPINGSSLPPFDVSNLWE